MFFLQLYDSRRKFILFNCIFPFSNRIMGALGRDDLQVYDRFIQHFKSAPKVTERSEHWKIWGGH